MRQVPFRIVALCVLLTPLCYGFTVQGLEYYLTGRYTRAIERGAIGDTEILLRGSIRLKDAVRTNIDHYLQQQQLLSWGVKAVVWVTGGETLLYPTAVADSEPSVLTENSREIASENYALLNGGISVAVTVAIGINTPISYFFLAFYIISALLTLFGFYRAGQRKIGLEEAAIHEKLSRLAEQERGLSVRLSELKEEREKASLERDRIEKTLEEERLKAGASEAELFEEIVQLDEKLSRNLELQETQQAEIQALTEKIAAYETETKKVRPPRIRETDLLAKRFGAIYKRISVHERALEGFADLTEDMKIKGEEIIHRLNEAPDQVPIKRKVFSGKGHEAVWEVLFAYNGRLYFRRHGDQQIEVLAVGTKNSQTRDLEFIDTISKRS